MTLPPSLHHKAQVLVAEYAGAVAPGRVIAIAVVTALAMHRRAAADPAVPTGDFLAQWEARTRRHLCDEVAHGLVRAAADGGGPGPGPAGPVR